ncbi:uncharacterized protein LOC126750168 [Anthonomus grandis grandis]|uniref:uncharacterized protein LOC126750168 n=1 Tax=Anthonomus grandis grandis TaxID=2921223 RepID=UPI00216630A2|nr:uncharacterized protein LOC126750168 [Anthonomus grandis grandis]
MAKLEHFGVRGKLLDLIKALRNERFYQVIVNGELSSPHRVSSGVIQGSVVGPVLFTSYLFDLVGFIKMDTSLFADDCKIYANSLTSAALLQADLQNVEMWSRQWGMKLNTSKCTVLRIGPDNPDNEYFLDGCALKSVNEQNDLGVLITSDLKWERHITRICKKANSLVYLIKQAFRDHSIEMISTLYKSYIRPKIQYAFVVWNPKEDIDQLEKLQRKVTKIPYELSEMPYPEKLIRFGLTTLRERRHRGDLIETYKITSAIWRTFSTIVKTIISEDIQGSLKKKERQNFPEKTL